MHSPAEQLQDLVIWACKQVLSRQESTLHGWQKIDSPSLQYLAECKGSKRDTSAWCGCHARPTTTNVTGGVPSMSCTCMHQCWVQAASQHQSSCEQMLQWTMMCEWLQSNNDVGDRSISVTTLLKYHSAPSENWGYTKIEMLVDVLKVMPTTPFFTPTCV